MTHERGKRLAWFISALLAGAVIVWVTFGPSTPEAPSVPLPKPKSPTAMNPAAQQLEARARAARNAPAQETIAQYKQVANSPCQSLQGTWRLDDGRQLTLGTGGKATIQPSAAREPAAARWLCMQDGTAEAHLAEGTRKLSRDAATDVLRLSNSRGDTVQGSRVSP
jgi:hypothetical protein